MLFKIHQKRACSEETHCTDTCPDVLCEHRKSCFYECFLASNENVACSTTLLSMQSCCAMSNFISCDENHIKNKIFSFYTVRRDTYPHNERSIQRAEMFSILWDTSDMTSNIELQTFEYHAQAQEEIQSYVCICKLVSTIWKPFGHNFVQSFGEF